jgi:hypothetical protein
LIPGVLQPHNLHRSNDEDWVKFQAQAGQTYILQTMVLSTSADTTLTLYDRDKGTQLAFNDDADSSLASRITWQAPATGTYYARVRHWNPAAGGCGTAYNLRIDPSSSVKTRLYLPVARR